jgi:hypothetical protein
LGFRLRSAQLGDNRPTKDRTMSRGGGMISTCDRHPRGRGSGNRGGDGPLGSGSQQGEESKSTATHGRCERGWSNDVHQLKDHGRIRSKRRSADQLEHQHGVVVVESNEPKSKKGEAGERAFSVRSPFSPCRDLEVSAWFFPIQVLKEIIIYLRTSSHLVIERRGKEGRESSGGDRSRPTSSRTPPSAKSGQKTRVSELER